MPYGQSGFASAHFAQLGGSPTSDLGDTQRSELSLELLELLLEVTLTLGPELVHPQLHRDTLRAANQHAVSLASPEGGHAFCGEGGPEHWTAEASA